MTIFKNAFLKNHTARFVMKHGLMVCAAIALCALAVYKKALPLSYDTYALYQLASEMVVCLFGCFIFTVTAAFFASNPTLK